MVINVPFKSFGTQEFPLEEAQAWIKLRAKAKRWTKAMAKAEAKHWIKARAEAF